MEKKSKNKATWIWYPGDFEVWLGNKFNNRRTERGAMFPPFWKQDSHYPTVEFSTKVNLDRQETITIATEGDFNLMLDGKLQFGMPGKFTVPAGEHSLNIKIHNQATPPTLFVKGRTIKSDSSWLATYEDKIWIDENGMAHGSGIYVPAASWNFDSIDTPPSTFQLKRTEMQPVDEEKIGANKWLFDFGLETFGYIRLKEVIGKGIINIYYGESREEALDMQHCETLDRLDLRHNEYENEKVEIVLDDSKAFRYVMVEARGMITYSDVSMDYEYSEFSHKKSGSFKCNNSRINKIWEVAAYTMDLTTREFFMDGIKRDRWTWSGDAIQSYLMNYYLRFDTECVKRTIRQLRGKDPVTAHINTIMDYTFYWFKSVLDYYMYTGDVAFVREIYPKMQTLMQYVLGRLNSDGMAEGQPDDWIFVDWVDFPMHKRGTLCFEQILLCKAFETMHTCAAVLRDNPLQNPPQGSITTAEYSEDADKFGKLAKDLKAKLKPTFWDDNFKVFLHAIEDGKMNRDITPFPNIFAIIYDMVDDDDKRELMDSVLYNYDIEPITTPYMLFYELEADCQMGYQNRVMPYLEGYWGGMLDEGATSFWEKFNPADEGAEHLAMYGRPYGKSLCHAWGASPIYLIGKYFLGVRPTKPGYEEYEVRPALGNLKRMQGSVPTPFGEVKVKMDDHTVTVKSDGGRGKLFIGGKEYEIPVNKEIKIEY